MSTQHPQRRWAVYRDRAEKRRDQEIRERERRRAEEARRWLLEYEARLEAEARRQKLLDAVEFVHCDSCGVRGVAGSVCRWCGLRLRKAA